MREQHALESDIEIKQDDDDRGGEDLVVRERSLLTQSLMHGVTAHRTRSVCSLGCQLAALYVEYEHGIR